MLRYQLRQTLLGSLGLEPTTMSTEGGESTLGRSKRRDIWKRQPLCQGTEVHVVVAVDDMYRNHALYIPGECEVRSG